MGAKFWQFTGQRCSGKSSLGTTPDRLWTGLGFMPATASGDIRKSQGDLFIQPKVVPQAPPWLNAHIKSSPRNEIPAKLERQHRFGTKQGTFHGDGRCSAIRRLAE